MRELLDFMDRIWSGPAEVDLLIMAGLLAVALAFTLWRRD